MSSAADREEGPTLLTERLVLRRWQPSDAEPFARLNADPLVMEYFPATLSRKESDALIERMDGLFREHGFGAWAVEVRESSALAGFVGLWPQVDRELPFAPATEIGWRLAKEWWGRGIASEAAAASLELAFGELDLEEVVAYTTVENQRSRAVMERLGMHRDPAEDFLHPALEESHPLAPHVLYRIGRGT